MMWLLLLLFTLCAGYGCTQTGSRKLVRTLIWLLPAGDVIAGYSLTHAYRPGYRMLILIVLLFAGMKAVTTVYRYPGKGRLTGLQWLAFALGWPGMDPQPFELLGKRNKVNTDRSLLYLGIASFFAGIVLLYLLALLLQHQLAAPYLICLFSFLPFILIFHIGLCNIGVVVWGYAGVDLIPLMEAPWRSENLGAFWGRRWNTAFIQMTRTTLFIPFARRKQPVAALLIAFLMSGIFHEIALTLPVGAGFGRPLLYFMLQALLVLIERRYGSSHRPTGLLYTWLSLLLPFPLLLPPAFLKEVIQPLLLSLPV
ncbi:MBOAT family protein [Taibaiella koreensis]|uniref:MBOAT family protein n=1 Tax=Taibaiella koreensis TaxID=1268548 RepID=UPI000E599701|nr:MBOAT family protein [Taibaiella koreensis]